MPSETVTSVQAAFQVAGQLAEARASLVQAAIEQVHAEHYLAFVRAQIESAAIEKAGGEKNLGSNEEARRRSLLLEVERHDVYTLARHAMLAADADHRMAEVTTRALADQLSILLSALEAGILDVSADLLTLNLTANRCAIALNDNIRWGDILTEVAA